MTTPPTTMTTTTTTAVGPLASYRTSEHTLSRQRFTALSLSPLTNEPHSYSNHSTWPAFGHRSHRSETQADQLSYLLRGNALKPSPVCLPCLRYGRLSFVRTFMLL